MMFQILFDHRCRHLPNCGTEVTSRPKMPSPITLFQMGKFFKQITRCSPFDPPHNLAWRQSRRRAHQNMHVIFAHHSTNDTNLKGFTGLPNQFPNPFCNFSFQNLITVFCYPNKVIFNLETPLWLPYLYSITHLRVRHYRIGAKADRLKPVV